MKRGSVYKTRNVFRLSTSCQTNSTNSPQTMDSFLTSPSLGLALLGISLVATSFWFLLHWFDEQSRRAYAARGLKYVQMGNMFVDIVLKRRIELKKDAAIKREGMLFGFNMLGRNTVLMAEPELIQQVVSKEFTNFTNRRVRVCKPDILSLTKCSTLSKGCRFFGSFFQ